jgi:hypothetical protein
MLIRISLIIAIVAGLAAAGISVIKVKEKIETVKSQRENEKQQKETAQKDLASTKKELGSTKTELASTKTELGNTQKERDTALAEADKQLKRAGQLSDELAKTKKDRDEARADLAAWAALGIPVNQVKDIIALAKQLQEEREVLLEEKKILARKLQKTENELARLVGKSDKGPPLPAALKGTIVVADPKWDFVVLNVGEEEGVLEYGELLVNRNGKLVAKVVVRTVQKGRSIANVMPGWKLGDVLEGDQVIPAYPAT